MTNLSHADWSRIPYHLRPELQRYVEKGHIPGKFLVGVLSDRLRLTLEALDTRSILALYDILDFVDTYLPPECHGKPEKLADWEGRGGLDGLELTEQFLRRAQR